MGMREDNKLKGEEHDNCVWPVLTVCALLMPSLLGIFPPPFCLASAHAHPLSPPRYCLLPTCDPTSSSQLPASTRNKNKKEIDNKDLHRDASDASLKLKFWGQTQIFNRYRSRSRTYKLLHTMAPRRVINRNLRVKPFSPKLFCYTLFRSISRYDYLLRHPRCRQLLHPSKSQPQTKGCPRMRHLRVRRTAHN